MFYVFVYFFIVNNAFLMQILCRQETIFCTRMNNNKKGAKNSIPNALQQGALSFFRDEKA